MCCFSANTQVHGTSIFARFARPGTQAIVYQMRYKAEQPTAMILPLPVKLPTRDDAIAWKSLKEYARFFDDLALGFPEKPSFSLSRSKSAAAAPAPQLAVHEVGDFIASYVPSVNDFERIDRRFTISKDVWAKIPAYADYGFAVFQLKQLEGTPHPIAFEFDTRSPETLFFPTVHIHDGTVHAEEHFDHVLYAQERSFDDRVSSYDGPAAVDDRTGFVRSKEKASAFAKVAMSQGLLDGDLLVHKTSIVGKHRNIDTLFDLRAGAKIGTAGGCGRCAVSPAGSVGAGVEGRWLPAAALAGLSWIIRRRDALRRRR